MRTSQSKFFQPALILAALSLLALVSQTHGATITWTNTSGGNWSNPNNWNPHQIPTNTDTVLITLPGTYVVNYDFTNIVTGPNAPSITNLTLGAGINSGGAQTLLASFPLRDTYGDNGEFVVNNALLITNGGVFQMTNGYLSAQSLIIDKGGAFNGVGEEEGGNVLVENGGTVTSLDGTLAAALMTITNGGMLHSVDDIIYGTMTVAKGGVASVNTLTRGVTMSAFVVQPGGTFNNAGTLIVDYPSTNYGVMNLTNSTFVAQDGLTAGGDTHGSLVNEPGGIINLSGNSTLLSESYFINQGTMMALNGTNSVQGFPFIGSQGTLTNESGIISVGLFETNVTGVFYAAAGATTQFIGADEANAQSSAQITLDPALVLGGAGTYQLISGYLYLSSNVPTNLQLMCDTVTLGPDFQGGTITNLVFSSRLSSTQNAQENLLNTLPVTGTFVATDLAILTNLVVNAGGNVTLNTSNPNFGTYPLFGSLTVAHGGTATFISYGVQNYGIGGITWTNAGIIVLSNVLAYLVNVQNEAGGVINLGGNCMVVTSSSSNPFINRGALVQTSGTTVISFSTTTTNLNNQSSYVYAPMNFDTSLGVVTNLSGVLTLPSFGSTLSGTFYTAAGATTQLGGGTSAHPTVPGTPLILAGPGLYEFMSGWLDYPNTAPSNLVLAGGNLQVGQNFQGGAITNLILGGIAYSNTLPIKGPVTVMNVGLGTDPDTATYHGFFGEGIQGTYLVENGGVLTVSNCVITNDIVVTHGGALNSIYTYNYFYNPITVAAGGTFYSTNGAMFAPVTITSGGVMNPAGYVEFYNPLTNSGTINLTNSGIYDNFNSAYNWEGEVVNQAGGIINIFDSTLPGTFGSEIGGNGPLINAGQINFLAGAGYAALWGATSVNAGTITAQAGPMMLYGAWTFTPASNLHLKINNATNYGTFIYTLTFPVISGNMAINGTLDATLASGYAPTNGTVFNLLSYGSETSTFSSLNLPSGVTWQSNYGATNFTLMAGNRQPVFAGFNLSGTNLVFYGTGGTAGSNYVILASTNLALPLTSWTALTTNPFDGSGQLHFTNPISPAKPRQFFIFKLP